MQRLSFWLRCDTHSQFEKLVYINYEYSIHGSRFVSMSLWDIHHFRIAVDFELRQINRFYFLSGTDEVLGFLSWMEDCRLFWLDAKIVENLGFRIQLSHGRAESE